MLSCFGIVFVFWCKQPEAPRAPALRCPPLVEYDRDTQKRAADQLRAIEPRSPVRQMVTDYGDLRARCRAIEAPPTN